MNTAERAAAIKEAIAQGQENAIPMERLWCKDDWKEFSKHRVPVDALVLNIDNRRFAAERRLLEEKLGHTLDPENNPNDELSVISILLDTGHKVDEEVVKGSETKDTIALRRDWLKRGQESPFWVRPDGTVRNGNRRLAMLKRLRGEEGKEGTRFVEAVVLEPSEINEEELFNMEQREQTTENFKVRYTDINLLLTLRAAAEGQRIDWNSPEDIERVAGEIQEAVGDKSYAAVQLRAIKYMDDYLAYTESPGQYQKLIGQIERFRDVGKIMATMLEEYPDDAVDMLQVLFAGITSGVTHGSIRSIGKIFREDRAEYQRLKDKVLGIQEQTAASTKLESPDLAAVEAELTEDEAEEPAPAVSDYPIDRVKSAVLDAIDGFQSRNLEINRKLSQAVERLRPITPTHITNALEGEGGGEIRQYVTDISNWVDSIKAVMQ